MIPQDFLLVKILKIVLSLIPEIPLEKGVGRPYVYKPVIVVCCFIVMVAKKLSVRALHAFLISNEAQAVAVKRTVPFPDGKIPSRRTFDRRLKDGILALQAYMLAGAMLLVHKFHVGIGRLALDNRMFEAFGALWHRKDQLAGTIPKGVRNVDKTAGWGISHYRGWVFGHALEVFVTTGKYVIPILASAHSLVKKGNTVVRPIVHFLPKVKKGAVSADSEYEDSVLGVLLKQTGRNLHAASKRRPKLTPKTKTYQRRKVTVEPFFERFLLAFVTGKLDRKGPQAWPVLITCCLLYQLMVIHNFMERAPNPLIVTHLIRML